MTKARGDKAYSSSIIIRSARDAIIRALSNPDVSKGRSNMLGTFSIMHARGKRQGQRYGAKVPGIVEIVVCKRTYILRTMSIFFKWPAATLKNNKLHGGQQSACHEGGEDGRKKSWRLDRRV